MIFEDQSSQCWRKVSLRTLALMRSEHGNSKRHADGQPVLEAAQLPQVLDRLFRTGDDDGIKAEQQSRKRRRQGAVVQYPVFC